MTEHVKVYGIKPRIQYTANGTLKTFEFPFAIFKTSDIDVYFGDVLQDASIYTVSGIRHSDGGSVTFESAPASGTIITIVRNLSIERTSDFQEGSTLRSKVLNDELDYQIACQQQIAENLNRSMVLPPYAADTGLDLTLPTPSAGKAIVWNSTGTNLENSTIAVNALESTIKNYKNQAQNAATTATNKANIATTQAQTATTQAGIAATKATEAISAVNQLNGIRTNCITEIPQDVKLELSSGTLTLKAGSKIYVPNGTGIFAGVTIPEDITTTASDNGERIVFTNSAGTSISSISSSNVTSGTTPPAGNGMFYNTSTNMINYYNSGTIGGQRAFPIAKITVSNGAISSIDQVFNGFGYIGSTLFALPGVKGLIPNGRDFDGTLVNTSFEITEVKTVSVSGSNADHVVRLSATTLAVGDLNYDENSNHNHIGTFSPANIRNFAIVGSVNYTSNLITALKIKPPFHSADYAEAVKYTDKALVTGWGMPDYSGSISLATSTDSYTAPKNGYITFTAIGNNNVAKAYVDDCVVFETNSQYASSNTFPIAKGSVFTRTGGSQILSIIFVPCQGG